MNTAEQIDKWCSRACRAYQKRALKRARRRALKRDLDGPTRLRAFIRGYAS